MILILPKEELNSSRKYFFFITNTIDDALDAIKEVVKEKYDFNYNIDFSKNFLNDKRVLLVSKDSRNYKKELDRNIQLHPTKNGHILRIQVRNMFGPIKYATEITDCLYNRWENNP